MAKSLLGGGGWQWGDGHVHAALGFAMELNVAINEREYGVVAAEPNIGARLPAGAALANDDVASDDAFAAELLDAEAPAFGVATVAG
jgi:hypothetical protein